MGSETAIVKECLIALSAAGCTVFRNNTGVLRDVRGRPVRYGLCNGSSDIIGVCPDGIFLAVECKTAKGRATATQKAFISAIRSSGGRAGIARSASDALRIALSPPGLSSE